MVSRQKVLTSEHVGCLTKSLTKGQPRQKIRAERVVDFSVQQLIRYWLL